MLLRCPKCFEALEKHEHIYKCPQGHSYDIAREGYVNLILANQKHSKEPGDSRDSLKSRQAFLQKGYYRPLAEALKESVNSLLEDGASFLDAGCGTGYYLNIVSSGEKRIEYYATDIARSGVAMTQKSNREAVCFVGNVFHLPLGDSSLDGLMSVFCPYSGEEFNRVIKPGRYVWAVTPGARHLYEIKELVYDEPYLNAETGYDMPGFVLQDSFKVTYQMDLECNEDINTLWKMTPYYHTTSPENNEKILSKDRMAATADFLVSVYRKEESL